MNDDNETVWLTQAQMAELFQTTPQNITIHISNVYNEGELEEESTCKDFLQVQNEGGRNVNRNKKFYNLDVIISVGYRVKSLRVSSVMVVRFREYAEIDFIMDNQLLWIRYKVSFLICFPMGRIV